MQAIPSAVDFLRHADIIEGTGEGEVRSQGGLKPIRRWRAENWGKNCEQQGEVRTPEHAEQQES